MVHSVPILNNYETVLEFLDIELIKLTIEVMKCDIYLTLKKYMIAKFTTFI